MARTNGRKRPAGKRKKSTKQQNRRALTLGMIVVILIAATLYVLEKWERPEVLPRPEVVEIDKGMAYAGYPVDVSYPGTIEILMNTGYVIGYSELKKNPAWVAYRLFPVDTAEAGERPSRFRVDERTTARIKHDDYTRTGYDRGHMAPNYAIATRFGQDAQLETFLMSNIVPQKPDLNRQLWRNVEMQVVQFYAQYLDEVWVVTGPVYDDHQELLPAGVEIPDAFFKIILDEAGQGRRALAFLIPQEVQGDEPMDQFLVSIDSIESATGLDFFSQLPDQEEAALERNQEPAIW